MRFAVTGSNGLVGSRLCRALAGKGHEVIGLSRGERRAQGDFDYQSLELTDFEQVKARLSELRPQVIINPASMTEVDRCEKDPVQAYQVNAAAPGALAMAAREIDAHLLHVSTDYVFDGKAGPYAEEDVPNPIGTYAITKQIGEQAVRALAPSWAIARTAVVYGWPPAARTNFGAWLVGTLEKGAEVRLFEDQFVSPSFADNVAAMLAELGERRLPGVWNTSGGEVLDRMSFGRALCQVFGFDARQLRAIKLREANLASPRPLHSGLKVDKARRELAAKPMGLTESLKAFHRAWMEQRRGA